MKINASVEFCTVATILHHLLIKIKFIRAKRPKMNVSKLKMCWKTFELIFWWHLNSTIKFATKCDDSFYSNGMSIRFWNTALQVLPNKWFFSIFKRNFSVLIHQIWEYIRLDLRTLTIFCTKSCWTFFCSKNDKNSKSNRIFWTNSNDSEFIFALRKKGKIVFGKNVHFGYLMIIQE